MIGCVEGIPVTKHVSATEINSYLGCQYRWWLRYVKGLQPIRTQTFFTLGRAVHQAFEADFKGEDFKQNILDYFDEVVMSEDFFDEELEELTNLRGAAIEIAQMAIDTFSETYEPINIDDELAVEYKFEIPLDFSHVNMFKGYIDVIAQEKMADRIWLVDHKILGSFISDEMEEYNLQMAVYQFALNQLGINNISGSIYNQISNKPMSSPKLNKNGTMSKTKIRCTWNHYKECLLDNGLDPDNYIDMMGKLADVSLNKPIRAFRSEIEVANVWNKIALPIIDRINNCFIRGVSPNVRNFNRFCNKCWAKDHCMADLRGDDVEFIENTLYKKTEHKEEGNNGSES